MQEHFSPLDTEHFAWTEDGWYSYDPKAAHKAALKARNARAKALEAMGYRVHKTTFPNQLVRRGGIGSGKPDVDFVVSAYCIDYRD